MLLHIASFYTEKLLHREALLQRSLYTEKQLHRETFTHGKLLHTEAFTHSKLSHREALTQRSFCTQKLSHREDLYTDKIFTHDFEALLKGHLKGKTPAPKLRKSADKSLLQPWCDHSNTIYDVQLQKTAEYDARSRGTKQPWRKQHNVICRDWAAKHNRTIRASMSAKQRLKRPFHCKLQRERNT